MNDPEVRQNIPKKEEEKGKDGEDEKEDDWAEGNNMDEVPDQDKQDGVYYYSVNEKAYRVLDPETETWTTQAEKPTEEQILAIKAKIAPKPDGEAAPEEPAAEPEEKPLTEEEIKKKE